MAKIKNNPHLQDPNYQEELAKYENPDPKSRIYS